MSLIWLLLLSGKKTLLLARDAEREELLHFHVEKKEKKLTCLLFSVLFNLFGRISIKILNCIRNIFPAAWFN